MTTVDPGAELIQQQARHQRLLREHAVLEAQEAQKAKRREEIRAQLKAAGVDPDRPEEEKRRLDAETAAALAENQRQLDEFEAKLKDTAGTIPTEDLNPPKPPGERTPPHASEPLSERAPNNGSDPFVLGSDGDGPGVLQPADRSAPIQTSEPKAASAPPQPSEPRAEKAPVQTSEPPKPRAPNATSEPNPMRAPLRESDTVLTVDLPDDIEI